MPHTQLNLKKYKKLYETFMAYIDSQIDVSSQLANESALKAALTNILRMFEHCDQLGQPAPGFVTQDDLMKIHQASPDIFRMFTHQSAFVQRLQGFEDKESNRRSSVAKQKWEEFYAHIKSLGQIESVPNVFFEIDMYDSGIPAESHEIDHQLQQLIYLLDPPTGEKSPLNETQQAQLYAFMMKFGHKLKKEINDFLDCSQEFSRSEALFEALKTKLHNNAMQQEEVKQSNILIETNKKRLFDNLSDREEEIRGKITALNQKYGRDNRQDNVQVPPTYFNYTDEERDKKFKEEEEKFNKNEELYNLEVELAHIEEQKEILIKQLNEPKEALLLDEKNLESLIPLQSLPKYLALKVEMDSINVSLEFLAHQRIVNRQKIIQLKEKLTTSLKDIVNHLDAESHGHQLSLRRIPHPNSLLTRSLKQLKNKANAFRASLITTNDTFEFEFEATYSKFMSCVNKENYSAAEKLVPKFSECLTHFYASHKELPSYISQSDLAQIYRIMPSAFATFCSNPLFKQKVLKGNGSAEEIEYGKSFYKNLKNSTRTGGFRKTYRKFIFYIKAQNYSAAEKLVPKLSEYLTRFYKSNKTLPQSVLSKNDLTLIYHTMPLAFASFYTNPLFEQRATQGNKGFYKGHLTLTANNNVANHNKQILNNIKHGSESELITKVHIVEVQLKAMLDLLAKDNSNSTQGIKDSVEQFQRFFADYSTKLSLKGNKKLELYRFLLAFIADFEQLITNKKHFPFTLFSTQGKTTQITPEKEQLNKLITAMKAVTDFISASEVKTKSSSHNDRQETSRRLAFH